MDKTLKKFTKACVFVKKTPFRKERAFFLSLLEITDYSLLSYSFDSNLFAVSISIL